MITRPNAGGGGAAVPVVDALDSTLVNAALSANQGRVLDEKKSDLIQRQDTSYVDDKFGDDSTGEAERMDRPFKTIEAVLEQIVDVSSDISLDNWAFDEFSLGEQLEDGRWIIIINSRSILQWTNGNDSRYVNYLAMPSSAVKAVGREPASDGRIYFANHSASAVVVNGVSVGSMHGFSYNINTKTYNMTDDWTMPAWNSSAPPAAASWTAIFKLTNGNLVYNNGDKTILCTPQGTILFNQVFGGSPGGITGQMRWCQSTISQPVIVGKYQALLTQDGKAFYFTGYTTTFMHFVWTEDYIVLRYELNNGCAYISRQWIAANGTVGATTINAPLFNFNPGTSWASQGVQMYANQFYFSSNPLRTVDITSVNANNLPTAVVASDALDINGNTFATGGNHMSVRIKGGLLFANKMMFVVDTYSGEDVGVALALLDVGVRQTTWTPAQVTASSGDVLKFWPSRISIVGHGRTNTRVDLSAYTYGVDVRGNDTWALSYNPTDTSSVKNVNVLNGYVDTITIASGTLTNCIVSSLTDLNAVVAVDCHITSLVADSGSGFYKRCLITNLVGNTNSTFLGCDILNAAAVTTAGVFSGCRLPVGFMVANAGATFNNCIEIY